MEKVSTQTKSHSVALPSVHSAHPQVCFRNMGPDERTVRLVHERNAKLRTALGPPIHATSVVVEPVGDAPLWDATVRIGAPLTPPVRARGPSPDLAVGQAFDQLHAHALAS